MFFCLFLVWLLLFASAFTIFVVIKASPADMTSFFLCVIACSLLGLSCGSNTSAPQCGPVFDNFGDLHIGRSLMQCAMSMSDPYQPITHVQRYVDAGVECKVSLKYAFNNLIAINELENTATLDFFYRLYWQDIRWNMTKEFWDLVPVSVYFDGVELYAVTFDVDDPIPYWRPDLHFVDALVSE
jgi:hypothetical protein